MSLMSMAAADRAEDTAERLLALIKKEKITDYNLEISHSRGLVDWDGVTFGVADKKLRVYGYCPICGMEAYSVPVNRLGDVADILENFKPMKHNCVEV